MRPDRGLYRWWTQFWERTELRLLIEKNHPAPKVHQAILSVRVYLCWYTFVRFPYARYSSISTVCPPFSKIVISADDSRCHGIRTSYCSRFKWVEDGRWMGLVYVPDDGQSVEITWWMCPLKMGASSCFAKVAYHKQRNGPQYDDRFTKTLVKLCMVAHKGKSSWWITTGYHESCKLKWRYCFPS